MRYTWLDEYLMQKPGVTKNTENWNWVRYMIGDKMFLAVCLDDRDQPYYITLKLDPLEGEFLREQYEDIIPGFYMNKIHWNSIKPDGKVPDELLKEMADKSYNLILKGFSKKRQQEILAVNKQNRKFTTHPKRWVVFLYVGQIFLQFYANNQSACHPERSRTFTE